MTHPADTEEQHAEGVTEYVLGFAFEGPRVALIRKNRPGWQAGKLNGIGGHIEPEDFSPGHAMVREFREETGLDWPRWQEFVVMSGPSWVVHCFRSFKCPLARLETKTDEQIEIRHTDEVMRTGSLMLISNLPWLVSLALDNNAQTYQIRSYGES